MQTYDALRFPILLAHHAAVLRCAPAASVSAYRSSGQGVGDRAFTLQLREITKDWKMPTREWHTAKAQFALLFGDRFETSH